jgi:hypothetical protein
MNSQTLSGLELSELAFEDAWLHGDEVALRHVLSRDVVVTVTDGTQLNLEALLALRRSPIVEPGSVILLHRLARCRGVNGTTCLQVQVDMHVEGGRVERNIMYMRSWRHDGSAWHVVESHGMFIP